MRLERGLLGLLLSLGLVPDYGCSSDPPPPPPPPTKLRFSVTDAASSAAIPKAVVVLGPDFVRLTADDAGKIELEVSAGPHAYRADAAGYVAIPEAFAKAPVAVAVAEQTIDVSVVLDPRPNAVPGGTISGKVTKDGQPVAGALIHAASTTDLSTLSDGDGRYVLFGLAPSLYTVTAYFGGHKSTTRPNVSAMVGMETKDVDLVLSTDAGSTISGVIGAGAGSTSVAIALAATGQPIPGLVARAAFSGPYSVPGVPSGRFVVRAGLEPDGVALDPDVIRTGMLPTVELSGTASASVPLVMAPAVAGLTVTTSTGTHFSWTAFPGAEFYVVEVRSITGQVLWGGFDARRAPRFRVRAPSTEINYGDLVPPIEALRPGQAYSLHVYAGKEVPQLSTFQLLGQSEELDGRFRAAR